jgi:hypothetical protein
VAIEKWHVLFCDGFIENVASWEIYELSKWSLLQALEIMELNTVL